MHIISMIMQEIKSALESINFLGVSGLVRFSSRGDRIAWTQIEQMVEGKYNLLGFYDTQTENLTWVTDKVTWAHKGKPPADRTIIQPTLKVVAPSLYLTCSAISGVGILFALSFILFNYRFRMFRYIQLSFPMANNLMLLGCIVCLTAVGFFGLDGKRIPNDYFIWMCYARASFMSIGFSLYFGSMFAKTWISYRLSTSSSKNKKIKNGQVYSLIGSFCLLDLIILVIWFFQSPMSRKVEIFDLESPDNTDEDVKIQPQLEHCDANLIWYGIIFGWKGLLLIFGLFLAYETRNKKIKQINDARLVGMSVYNVVILCAITGPVSLVISNQVNAHFAFIAITIIFCTFMTMILVFAPKVSEMMRRRGAHGLAQPNGTFNETLTTKEEEEKLDRLVTENDDLKAKITEKENQIDDVTKQIECLTREAIANKGSLKGAASAAAPTSKKAVRIQEPTIEDGGAIMSGADCQGENGSITVICGGSSSYSHTSESAQVQVLGVQFLDPVPGHKIDPVSDSGYQSTRPTSRQSEVELNPESYL